MFALPIKVTKTPSEAAAARASKSQQYTAMPRWASPQLVQPKLVVGAVNDPLEDEADRVADQVTTMPEAAVAISTSAAEEGRVQRLCAECEEEVKRKSEGGAGSVGGPAAPASEKTIRSLTGGSPLSASERAYFEPRFGRDFSAVRVHHDATAGVAARSIGARAFTLGSDIAFAPGEYTAGTGEGRRLLAHELTHVMQQADARAPQVMRKPYPGCDKKTTGVDDADARIDRERAEALTIMSVARAALPRMTARTIRLAHRHFHCPTSSQIVTITAALAAIEKLIPSQVSCVTGINKCRGVSAWSVSNGVLELCPSAFESAEASGVIAGDFIWAGGILAGFDNLCQFGTCLDDFTIPPSEMMKHALTYRRFAMELAGYSQPEPSTIPCAPRSTGMYVSVPPTGAINQIRPVTGREPSPPPGSAVFTVHEDIAGHKFVYFDDHPYAQKFVPDEPKRLYLDKGVFAVMPQAEMEKLLKESEESEKQEKQKRKRR